MFILSIIDFLVQRMSCAELFTLAKRGGVIPRRAIHVSGALETSASDIDVLVGLPRGEDERYVELDFYGREVNVLYSADPKRLIALEHRLVCRRLEREFPVWAHQARELKSKGMSTEPAWAEVLGLPGCPYQALREYPF